MLVRLLILIVLTGPTLCWAQFDIAALQTRFPAPFKNAGPNCYNTTLVSLGYVDEQIYVNGAEVKFYLNHFCEKQNISALNAPNGNIVVYRETKNLNSNLVHAASLLGNGMVFEKNNYQGTATRPDAPASFRGEYLFHPLSDSYYFMAVDAELQTVYSCQSAQRVKAALRGIESTDWALSLKRLRISLSKNIATLDLQDLHVYLAGAAFSDLYELNQILAEKTESRLEKEYLITYARSVHGQIYYSFRSYREFCKSCFVAETALLDSELQKTMSLIGELEGAK